MITRRVSGRLRRRLAAGMRAAAFRTFASNSSRKFLRNDWIGIASESARKQIVSPDMSVAIERSVSRSRGVPLPRLDPLEDAVRPAGALAARRALAARLVRVEAREHREQADHVLRRRRSR